jgi:CubicO group peptidase (beta-lactamase class C family)
VRVVTRGDAGAAEIAASIVTEGVAPLAAAACAIKVSPPAAPIAWRSERGGAEATFFDLASITKPMTAVAVARAGIERRTPLAALVPELADTPGGEATIELLLAHRAGLAAHVALFAPLLEGKDIDKSAALRVAAEARRPDAVGDLPAEGFPPVYSDVGYLLAGEALARATGARDAGEAIERLVVLPLGLGAELGTARELEARGVALDRLAAPTEDAPWRGGVVRGRVHDENAWALSGAGGSGHAGMFGTVGAVLGFGCAVLDALESTSAALGVDLSWLVAPRSGGTLRAGFDGKSDAGSSAGEVAGPRTFGHLGFTGTSLWIDPDARSVVVLLTNRVHPTRDHVSIRTARPAAHDALFLRARALAR